MKPTHGSAWRATLGVLVAASAAALLGCDGENLFRTDNPPEIEEFFASSDIVEEQDSVTLYVYARGPRLLQSITVELTGAMTRDTTFSFEAAERSDEVFDSVRVYVPAQTDTSALVASAYVTDVGGNESEAASLVLAVLDASPPEVFGDVSLTALEPGSPITVTVRAEDARGVETVGARIYQPEGDDVLFDTTVERTISPPEDVVVADLDFQLPGLDPGDLLVVPFAVDVNGHRGEAQPAELTLEDRKGPTFLSLETTPDSTIPLHDSLRVEVGVRDPSGIQRVTFYGLAYRGDASMGTDSVVERFTRKSISFPRPTEGDTLPTEYVLDPYLFAPDTLTLEDITVFVVAEDGAGNVSDTTKAMYVGGPQVTITYPPREFAVSPGNAFDARISVRDRTSIDSAALVLTTAQGRTRFKLDLPARTDTPMVLVQEVVMPSSPGTVELQAFAWNASEIQGQSRVAEVDVVTGVVTDSVPPLVSLEVERLSPNATDQRMELQDEIRAMVSAFDGASGLRRIGLTVVASRIDTQFTVHQDAFYSGSRSLEQLTFQVPVDSIYDLLGVDTAQAARDALLPEDLDLRFHGFAVDVAGNAACAVGEDERRRCQPDEGDPETTFFAAADTAGYFLGIDAVRGRTVLLAVENAVIADLAVDTVEERLFMSDIRNSLVWGVPLYSDQTTLVQDSQFSVAVGAAPWGIFVGERAEGERMLIVGNSGGRNMSFVNLDGPVSAVEEVDSIRLQAPNAVLREIRIESDDFGATRYVENDPIDFSDRPQFLAQDSLLRVVYSTVGTSVAPRTTVRYVITDPAPAVDTDTAEVRFIINDDMIDPAADETFAVANVDGIDIRYLEGEADQIRFVGHEPGFPGTPIETAYYRQPQEAMEAYNQAIYNILAARGDEAQYGMYAGLLRRGTWQLDAISFSDTTFVSASTDRGRIIIGEGGGALPGRLIAWFAEPSAVTSPAISIVDNQNNLSDYVLGVGLNYDGSMGVVRGREATHFFETSRRPLYDLGLLGEVGHSAPGGAGADFHPEHNDLHDGGSPDPTGGGFAFTGTPTKTVEITNTFHFYGEAGGLEQIPIRDTIIGPLKVGPPLRGERCAPGVRDDDCIVAKLYAITSVGGVIILNIRQGDLELQPLP